VAGHNTASAAPDVPSRSTDKRQAHAIFIRDDKQILAEALGIVCKQTQEVAGRALTIFANKAPEPGLQVLDFRLQL
jgi:hypothetical protein